MAGRPLGEISIAILDAVSDAPLPARDIAQRLQLSPPTARRAIYELVQCGRLAATDRVRLPGAFKPAALYRRAGVVPRPTPSPSNWFGAQATM